MAKYDFVLSFSGVFEFLEQGVGSGEWKWGEGSNQILWILCVCLAVEVEMYWGVLLQKKGEVLMREHSKDMMRVESRLLVKKLG